MSELETLTAPRWRMVLYAPNRVFGSRYPLGAFVERPGKLDFVPRLGTPPGPEFFLLSSKENTAENYRAIQTYLFAHSEAEDFAEPNDAFNGLLVYGPIYAFPDPFEEDLVSWVRKLINGDLQESK